MPFTPGPWRLCKETQTDRGRMWGINAWESTSGWTGDARLAEVFSIEANARLVAAAPDLLRLLNSMCAFAYAVVNPGALTQDYHDAMALIATIETEKKED